MAGELLINADGSIGIGFAGEASVVYDDGRCPVCGCGQYDDDGGPTDPPPPVEPDTYYLASPCDPNATPLDHPVVFYVPPRDQWPPDGYKYDCHAASRQETSGRAECYFFSSSSPKVTGEVVRDPFSPFIEIGGVDYYEVGANPAQSTCCACRPDCGVFRTPYYTEIIEDDPNAPLIACDPDTADSLTRTCCCDADGDITYTGTLRITDSSWTQNTYPPYQWLPTSSETIQRLSGKRTDPGLPGVCTYDIETTVNTWRDTGTQLVPEVIVTRQQQLYASCAGCAYPEFGPEPWECQVRSGSFGCSGFVEYRCNRYTGRRECKIDNGPLIPVGTYAIVWNQQAVFTQGDCANGCDSDTEPAARPPGPLAINGRRGAAPGGVPRLF